MKPKSKLTKLVTTSTEDHDGRALTYIFFSVLPRGDWPERFISEADVGSYLKVSILRVKTPVANRQGVLLKKWTSMSNERLAIAVAMTIHGDRRTGGNAVHTVRSKALVDLVKDFSRLTEADVTRICSLISVRSKSEHDTRQVQLFPRAWAVVGRLLGEVRIAKNRHTHIAYAALYDVYKKNGIGLKELSSDLAQFFWENPGLAEIDSIKKRIQKGRAIVAPHLEFWTKQNREKNG